MNQGEIILKEKEKQINQKKINKTLMHLFRIYLMGSELLEEGEINTFRKDRKFLLEIRNGKFIKDGRLTDECLEYLSKLEERFEKAKDLDILPDKPNYNEIEKFVIEMNSKVINDTILKYKEPLGLVRIKA